MTWLPVSRGQVVLVRLDADGGTQAPAGEFGGTRPCVVVQNDEGNQTSPGTIVVSVRARSSKDLRILVPIDAPEGGLNKNSVADCSHIATIGRSRIVRTLGALKPGTVRMIDQALKRALNLK